MCLTHWQSVNKNSVTTTMAATWPQCRPGNSEPSPVSRATSDICDKQLAKFIYYEIVHEVAAWTDYRHVAVVQ